MSLPILYKGNETDFDTLGIGVLLDTISCLVTQERNGQFDMEMNYPVDGVLFSEILSDRVIKCDASRDLPAQLFRIVKISKPLNGICTIYAQHVSYLTEGLQLVPEVTLNRAIAQEALNAWKSAIVEPHPFTVYSDIEIENSTEWTVQNNENARTALGGKDHSILNIWGGDFKFDNYHISLLKNRGCNNGVVIAYGKNLTSLTQEESIEDTYTSIYPYAKVKSEETGEEETKTLEFPHYLDGPNAHMFSRRKILKVDLSGDDVQNQTDLYIAAQRYIAENNIGVPKVNLKVSHIDLSNTLEYSNAAMFEQIELCDTVTIRFEKLGIDTTAQVVRVVWDVLQECYDTLEIGEPKANLGTRMTALDGQIKEKPTQEYVISAITEALVKESVGYVMLQPATNPRELLIMDTDNIDTATNVWKWDRNGLSHSTQGYRGTFTRVMTQAGEIVADYIKTGTMDGARIGGSINGGLITGVIQNAAGNTKIDLQNGNSNLQGQFSATGNGGITAVLQSGEVALYKGSDPLGRFAPNAGGTGSDVSAASFTAHLPASSGGASKPIAGIEPGSNETFIQTDTITVDGKTAVWKTIEIDGETHEILGR